MTPKQAIKHYGSQAAIVKRFGWSRQRVSYWVVKNKIPLGPQLLMQMDSGGKLRASK